MNGPLISHFAEIMVGTLATQLVLGGIALLWFYAVGKRIVSVELPAFQRGVEEHMDKIERRLDDIERDLRELLQARAEGKVRIDALSDRVNRIEQIELRGGSRRPPGR